MADTKIEWTNKVWNPVVGCSVISPGCTNCYAMRMAGRLEAMGQPIYQGLTTKTKSGYVWNGKVEASNWGQVTAPLRWKKARRIFVNSMSDLFHDGLPHATIDQVFAVMAACPQHTFQVLTKRSARMREYMTGVTHGRQRAERWGRALDPAADVSGHGPHHNMIVEGARMWPLPNVWLGVSVEDQQRADERIPDLLATPAAVRFLSCEPLLGRVNLTRLGHDGDGVIDALRGEDWIEQWLDSEGRKRQRVVVNEREHIDWVICGGESQHGARPMHPDWARGLRDQCTAAGVPFFFKQSGRYTSRTPKGTTYGRH